MVESRVPRLFGFLGGGGSATVTEVSNQWVDENAIKIFLCLLYFLLLRLTNVGQAGNVLLCSITSF